MSRFSVSSNGCWSSRSTFCFADKLREFWVRVWLESRTSFLTRYASIHFPLQPSCNFCSENIIKPCCTSLLSYNPWIWGEKVIFKARKWNKKYSWVWPLLSLSLTGIAQQFCNHRDDWYQILSDRSFSKKVRNDLIKKCRPSKIGKEIYDTNDENNMSELR